MEDNRCFYCGETAEKVCDQVLMERLQDGRVLFRSDLATCDRPICDKHAGESHLTHYNFGDDPHEWDTQDLCADCDRMHHSTNIEQVKWAFLCREPFTGNLPSVRPTRRLSRV